MAWLGRLTALSKPGGGVKGIIAGDVVRPLMAKTMSPQLSPAVDGAMHQNAMTTNNDCF